MSKSHLQRKIRFFIPFPMQQPLDVDANSSCSRTPAGTGSCHVSSDVQLHGGHSLWAPAAVSGTTLRTKHAGSWRARGGGTTTSVWSWAIRVFGFQAAWPLANFRAWGMAHKIRQPICATRSILVLLEEEQIRWTSRYKETVCLYVLSQASFSLPFARKNKH